MIPFVKDVIMKSLKHNEAAAKNQGLLSSLTGSVQYSNQTATGSPVDIYMNKNEAEDHLGALTDYFNTNLETLCMYMAPNLAREVIKRIWDDSLSVIEYAMVPQLYGSIESSRRALNPRQASFLKWSIEILRDFFHADGAELGVPIKLLENRKFTELKRLVDSFFASRDDLKRDYEASLAQGRERTLLLRMLRLRFEKDDVSVAERESGKQWIERMLEQRKEKS
jgi:hypothetical protein